MKRLKTINFSIVFYVTSSYFEKHVYRNCYTFMISSFWILIKKCCWGKSVNLKCFQETLASKLQKLKFCVHFVPIQNCSSRHLLLATFFGKWILATFHARNFFENDFLQYLMSATFCIKVARKISQLLQLFLPATSRYSCKRCHDFEEYCIWEG